MLECGLEPYDTFMCKDTASQILHIVVKLSQALTHLSTLCKMLHIQVGGVISRIQIINTLILRITAVDIFGVTVDILSITAVDIFRVTEVG